MSRVNDIKSVEQAEAERESQEAEADHEFEQLVLDREIDWKEYESGGMNYINKKELGMILDYDKQTNDQPDLLADKGSEYAALFCKMLGVIQKKDTLEYIIFLVHRLLDADHSRAAYFVSLLPQVDVCAPFLRILTSPELGHNPYTLSRTTHILAILLGAIPDETCFTMVTFMRYLISRISSYSSSSTSSSSNRELLVSLNALKLILKREKTQDLFAQQDGIKALANLMNKETTNAQLLYTVGFNTWLLSYNLNMCKQLQEQGVIRKIVGIVKVNVMEKVVRICFAILRNMLEHNVDSFNEEMIGHGLVQINETLMKRKFKDPDVVSDMSRISDVLAETIKRLSTFDMYHSEVISGNLSWTPAHKNEVFWRENIQQFEDKNYEIVRKLIDLMADQEDLVREVACHDVGEFARFHADGKKLISSLGGKSKLMINLRDRNDKVAKAALLATQKLMVANWEFLSKSSSGGVAALVGANKK